MGVYDEDIQTALEMIAEAGDDSTITRVIPGVRPDPDPTPWNPVESQEVVTAVKAVWLPYSDSRAGDRFQGSSLIHSGDIKVLVAAASIANITASDQITSSSGEVHQVIDVKTLAPNGQKILFTLQARRQ